MSFFKAQNCSTASFLDPGSCIRIRHIFAVMKTGEIWMLFYSFHVPGYPYILLAHSAISLDTALIFFKIQVYLTPLLLLYTVLSAVLCSRGCVLSPRFMSQLER